MLHETWEDYAATLANTDDPQDVIKVFKELASTLNLEVSEVDGNIKLFAKSGTNILF